jgi:hypothetical protein
MKEKITILVLLIVIAFLLLVLELPSSRVYDCSLSEISPDFPIDVKNECRRLRIEEYNKFKIIKESITVT